MERHTKRIGCGFLVLSVVAAGGFWLTAMGRISHDKSTNSEIDVLWSYGKAVPLGIVVPPHNRWIEHAFVAERSRDNSRYAAVLILDDQYRTDRILPPRIGRLANCHLSRIRLTEEPSVIGRSVEPVRPSLALKDNRPPVVDALDVDASLRHHHRIGRTPFGGVSPYPRDGKDFVVRQGEPVRVIAPRSPSASANSETGIRHRRAWKLGRQKPPSSLSVLASLTGFGLSG